MSDDRDYDDDDDDDNNNIIDKYVTNTMEPRVLHENVTVPQIVMKFPAFHGTRWFFAAFIKSRYLFLS